MEKKLTAIVLRSIDYKENDKLVTLFSLEEGLVTANIRGVRRVGAKLRFASAPFCFAEYVLAERSGRHTVTSASALGNFYALREDVGKLYSASIALELCNKFVLEGEPNRELFLLTVKHFESLVYEDGVNCADAAARFLLSALAITGYGLDFSACINCGGEISNRAFFDFSSNGCLCFNCRERGKEIRYSTYEAAKSLSEGGAADDATPVLKLLDYYISAKSGETLKSLKDFIAFR